MKQVLFLGIGDSSTPSSRFRHYEYLPYLKSLTCRSFNPDLFSRIKFNLFLWLKPCDSLVLQKIVLTPIEYRNIFLFKKFFKSVKLIFDIDDNIELYLDKRKKFLLHKYLKMCDYVICGNMLLKDMYIEYNSVYLPTSLKLNKEIKTNNDTNVVRIGWIGTSNNFIYLKKYSDVLRSLVQSNLVEVLICSDKDPNFDYGYTFLPWSVESEVDFLNNITIGLMPLKNDDWTKYKCGFKALQYMANGVICYTNKVGINEEFISRGICLDMNALDMKIIRERVHSPLLANELKQKAFNYVYNNYNIDKWALVYEKIIG